MSMRGLQLLPLHDKRDVMQGGGVRKGAIQECSYTSETRGEEAGGSFWNQQWTAASGTAVDVSWHEKLPRYRKYCTNSKRFIVYPFRKEQEHLFTDIPDIQVFTMTPDQVIRAWRNAFNDGE